MLSPRSRARLNAPTAGPLRFSAPTTATPRFGARTTVILAALVALICAGSALARTRTVTQTASASLRGGGTVQARLSYTPTSYYAAHLHLSITRDGRSLLSRTLTGPECGHRCAVLDAHHGVQVVDLQNTGEPTVLVDLYTGGAHCCAVSELFSYAAVSHRYRETVHNWGDPGYRLRTFGTSHVFETTDDRFAYAFTDYAASGMPLRFLTFTGSSFINVTRRYPALIRQDAALWLKAFTSQASQHYPDGEGVIAAWAADEDELGYSAQVASFLTHEAALGHLQSGIPGLSGGATFVRQLNAFLVRTGYLHS